MSFASHKFVSVIRNCCWLCFLATIFALPIFAAPPRPLTPGHVPLIARNLQSNGNLPGSTRLNLAIGLHWRDAQSLTNLLRDIYDPASPHYHHFLTSQEFISRFAPTEQDYEIVRVFARTNHLQITGIHSNRVLVDVSGASADVERAFHIHLRTYPHPTERRNFFAPDAEPSVDQGVPILDVSGLSNFQLPRPMIAGIKSLDEPSTTAPQGGSGRNGTYRGGDFRAAYLPGVTLDGSGQTLGLLEFDGFYTNDIAAYKTQSGLPDVPVQTILIDNYNGTPTPGTNRLNAEVSMDIEIAIAMAPGLSNIIVYEAGSSGTPNDILSRMATDNAAKQLSCSWGWGGGPQSTTDGIFQQMAMQGQSFFSASGDGDAYPTGAIDNPALVNAPSDNPYITIVGGTSLTTTGPGGSWVSETVWNPGSGVGSGGGISSFYAIPSWQQGVATSANAGSSTMRNIPDVAMTADNIYVTYANGTNGGFSGTSCAAPLWAAMMALVNQKTATLGLPPIGFLNPSIYAIAQGANYSSDFHDITVGSNTTSQSQVNFRAVPGFDLCTGWGSPMGIGIINDLVAAADPLNILPVAGFQATGLAGGPFSMASKDFTLSNTGPVTLSWALSNASPWLNISITNGTTPPSAIPTTVTFSLNSAANLLAAGTYTAVVWFTNLNSGVVQNREFTITILPQLVQNGGFETGTFANWLDSSNVAFTTVNGGIYAHTGLYGAKLGPGGSLGSLSQTLATVPGQTYLISFWLENPLPGTPNEFSASWNGIKFYDHTNIGTLAWTNLHFIAAATSNATVLQFGFRNDQQYFGLDDIAVLPFKPPTFQSVTHSNQTVQFSWAATAGLAYQLQFKTNLLQTNWINLGPSLTTTNNILTYSDTVTNDPQRFYRITIPQ